MRRYGRGFLIGGLIGIWLERLDFNNLWLGIIIIGTGLMIEALGISRGEGL